MAGHPPPLPPAWGPGVMKVTKKKVNRNVTRNVAYSRTSPYAVKFYHSKNG